MFQPKVVTLSEAHVHIRSRGPAEFRPPDFTNVTKHAETIVWDPAVDGILGGEGALSESSDHAGERHLDADEVLYLISGAMRLSLELDDGSTAEVPLSHGQAVIVPQGVWHRLIVDEPIRLLFFGGGRTEIRPSVQR
jgi:mannose-6-phosphate isomerase-like protein (cupin superfamily)